MSTIYMVKNIKELFPEYVLLVKIGTFYECYNSDAYIISYLFNYKIKTLIDGDKNCGFPTNSINKIISMLETKTINYIVVDKKHNYEEEVEHLKQVFGESSCSVYSSYVGCVDDDFYCTANSSGNVGCYGFVAGHNCDVSDNGDVDCS